MCCHLHRRRLGHRGAHTTTCQVTRLVSDGAGMLAQRSGLGPGFSTTRLLPPFRASGPLLCTLSQRATSPDKGVTCHSPGTPHQRLPCDVLSPLLEGRDARSQRTLLTHTASSRGLSNSASPRTPTLSSGSDNIRCLQGTEYGGSFNPGS